MEFCLHLTSALEKYVSACQLASCYVLLENGLGIDAANKGRVISCTLKTLSKFAYSLSCATFFYSFSVQCLVNIFRRYTIIAVGLNLQLSLICLSQGKSAVF